MVTTYYGANFRHAVAPTKPIVGVVRDKDTKKPLAGATVRSYVRTNGKGMYRHVDIVRTTTDAEGRYRLMGMPKGEGYKIAVVPNGDQPYVATNIDVPDSPGLDPVTVDIELRRGVWIEGRISDKVTGKPMKVAMEYFSLYANPNLHDYPGFDGTILFDETGPSRMKEDGTYRIVGLPGPGLIAVHVPTGYLRANGRDDEFGVKETRLSTAPYHLMFTSNYGALARVDPEKGVESVKRDVTLEPGITFTGTVVGPDGKPLAGARSFGVADMQWKGNERMNTAEFAVHGFSPRQARDVVFQYPEKGLVGVAHPPKENGGSVTVQLVPGATVTGRLVDADGKPRPGVSLESRFHRKGIGRTTHPYSAEPIKTDADGRFRIEALVPGFEFELRDGRAGFRFGDELKSGEVKDLGDVRPERTRE
jgi:Carboxypeptidase regulatory-like domain